MLGMRRAGVTEAASALKRQKLIKYQRGETQILDLKGLKTTSCSCYQIVQTAFKRAQGQGTRVGDRRVVRLRHEVPADPVSSAVTGGASRQPFVKFQRAAIEEPGIESLFAGVVFRAGQRTVVIRIASGEVLAEPLVGPDVIRS
jgi:hypothetical protein